MISNIRHLFRLQRPEVHLHAAGTQRGRNFRRAAGSCTHQPEIGWQPVFENIVDITRNGSVLRTVIGRLQHDLPIFQHLEQLVHLNGMQFADLIQKQHAAMGLSHCAGFRLRNALHAQRACALINRVVHTADQRVCYRPFVKTDAGSVHFDEGRVGAKGRSRALFGCFQHQTGGAGLSDARRAVDDDVLRIFAAKDRFQGFDPVLLTHDVRKLGGANFFRQRLAEPQRPQFLQLFQFPSAVAAVRRLRFLLAA